MAIDGTGNITYGYFGAALKLAFPILIGGGGAAQVNDNLLGGAINPNEVVKGNFKSLKNIRKEVIIKSITADKSYDPIWVLTSFDDPYDQDWMKYGYDLYNKI